MMRKSAGHSSFLAMIAVLTALVGCDANEARNLGTQFATPVTPTALQITISSDRSSIRAGTTTSALITWSAINVPQGTPVPNGTIANVSTTLGSLNSLGGATTAQIEMFGGTASIRLFAPTTGQGTARVRVEIDGVVAVVEVTITAEAGPPVPAPTAATITLGADTLIVVDDDSSVDILLTATVLGSNASPFNNAPVQMSSPTGNFDTSGSSTSDILATGSDGMTSDTLNVDGTLLTGINSFTVTATLFTEGGGTKTATVTITVVHADDPPVATSLEIISISPDSTMQRGSGPQSATITALLLDQFDQPFDGALITFSTALGSLSGGDQTNDDIDTTDADGLASVDLAVTQGQLDAFAGASFLVMASSPGVGSDTAPITVTGAGEEELVPTNVQLFVDRNFIPDNGAPDEDVDLTALVTDQNGDPLDDIVVTFSSTFGTPSPTTDDTGTVNPGEAESTLTLDEAAITAFPGNSFTVTATITTPNGVDTSQQVISIIRPPLADFAFSGTSGLSVVNFDDNSTNGPTSWSWDFDNDSTPESAIQNPTFDYSTSGFACAGAGGCSATLTVSNAAGSSSVTKFIPLPLP